MIDALISHKSIHWATPKKLYNAYMELGFLDPVPYKCETNNFFTMYDDALVYINPPFCDLEIYVNYIIMLCSRGCRVHLLMPCRTSTKYFRKLYDFGLIKVIYFITGRVHFNDVKSGAPFDTMVLDCYYGDGYGTFYTFNIDEFEGFLRREF